LQSATTYSASHKWRGFNAPSRGDIQLAEYKITCATKVHPHRHIIEIGGPDGRWTVEEARRLITAGVEFYTVSPTTRQRALVDRWSCRLCGYLTVRTIADSTADNNLDNLPNCQARL
jgi:hypothetical protein